MMESDIERESVEIRKRAQSTLLRRSVAPVLLVVFTLALAAPFFDVPMQRDQGVYAACGSILLHGGAPYRDCWDTKAPLTHYTYALAQLLFGIDLRGPVILSACVAGLTGLVLWHIARRWFDERSEWLAWAVGLLYAWLVVSIPFDMNAQSEGFANLFIALGVWGAISGIERDSRWRIFGVGAALAFAVAYKYTILLPASVALLGAFLVKGQPSTASSQRRSLSLHYLLPAGLGFVATIALFTAYLLARGALNFALEHMIFMLTEFPKVVVNPTLLLFPGESGPPLFYLQRTWYQIARLPVVHLLGIAGSLIALARKRAWAWLISLWLAASLLSVYPQKVMTLYHWTLSLIPLALGAGALVWEFRSRAWVVVAASLSLFANLGIRVYQDQWLISGTYLTGRQTKTEFYASQAIQDEIEVAEYVRDRTRPDDLMWVWGNHSIMYYWSDR